MGPRGSRFIGGGERESECKGEKRMLNYIIKDGVHTAGRSYKVCIDGN